MNLADRADPVAPMPARGRLAFDVRATARSVGQGLNVALEIECRQSGIALPDVRPARPAKLVEDAYWQMVLLLVAAGDAGNHDLVAPAHRVSSSVQRAPSQA